MSHKIHSILNGLGLFFLFRPKDMNPKRNVINEKQEQQIKRRVKVTSTNGIGLSFLRYVSFL